VERARPAVTGDIDALARLWDAAVGELDGQRGGALLAGVLTRPEVAAYLTEAIENPDHLVVVGMIDEVQVGLASVVCQRDRREIVGNLELVYVDPAARQVGVAELMLEVVIAWCRRAGCIGIDAPALPGNRAAKTFFEGKGFLARLLLMHYPLGDARP
jgi:GNAT superfamily N-acetyltransferase